MQMAQPDATRCNPWLSASLFALEVISHGRQVGQDVVPLHPALVGALEDVDASRPQKAATPHSEP